MPQMRHACPDWDFLMIGPGDREMEACLCGDAYALRSEVQTAAPEISQERECGTVADVRPGAPPSKDEAAPEWEGCTHLDCLPECDVINHHCERYARTVK